MDICAWVFVGEADQADQERCSFRVACGIMTGFVMNLIIVAATGALATPAAATDGSDVVKQVWALRWILGAPAIFGVALLVVVFFCYESPRFYLREKTPSYNPNRALEVLLKLRETKVRSCHQTTPCLIVFFMHREREREKERVRSHTYIF